MHVETERKYTVPAHPDRVGDDLAINLVEPFGWGEHQAFTLVADYVDTPDLALVRADHTLRRRTGGADQGWHLKGPKVRDTRLERHAPLAAGRSAALVPLELREAVAEIVGLDALVPVARLVTRRREHQLLRLADAGVVALVADDRVEASAMGGRSIAWREVEVELVEGTAADLEAIEQVFLAHGLSPSSDGPKVAHALGVVGAGGPEAPAEAEPSVGDVVLAHLRRQVGAMQGWEGRTRSDDPDAVHKHRVATRRLRSSLRSFRNLLDRTITAPIAMEVRWLAEQLGAPRDAEVLRDRLLADLAELDPGEVVGDVSERLPAALERAHAEAHAALLVALDSDRHQALMEALVGLLVHPPLRHERAARPAEQALAKISTKVGERVEAARALALAHPDGDRGRHLLHEVRKKAKAARYAHEAFGDLGAGAAAEVAERWEAVTEALGEVQDSTVAVARLRELAATAAVAGQPTATYDLLVEREQQRGREALAVAEQALDRAGGGGREKP